MVDRIGFTVKLANGEFFSPQRAEWVYEETCQTVSSCVLFARPGDTAATAIVIPAGGSELLEQQTRVGLEAAVMAEMCAAAASDGLHSWEVPSKVLFDDGPWDEQNGCCSAHGKVRRLAIAQRNGLLQTPGKARVSSAVCLRIHAQPTPETTINDDPLIHTHRLCANCEQVEQQLPLERSFLRSQDAVTPAEHKSSVHQNQSPQHANAIDEEDLLIRTVLSFLSAPDENDDLLRMIPSANVTAHGVDWWSALGGDSISATALIAKWEQKERESSDNCIPRERPQRRSVQRRRRERGQDQPSLVVHDVFTLTLWQLREKAQARLQQVHPHAHCHTSNVDRTDNADDSAPETGSDGSDDPAESLSTPFGPDSALWEHEAAATSARASVRAAAAAMAASESADDVDNSSSCTDEDSRDPCVLLTSGTGFLGPHLLEALFDVATATHCWSTIVVLVRQPIDRVRLPSSYVRHRALDSGNHERGVHAEFKSAAGDVRHADACNRAAPEAGDCANSHAAIASAPAPAPALALVPVTIRCFAADLSLPNLGLSEADRSSLMAMKFTAVVHSAAAVDHARSCAHCRHLLPEPGPRLACY